jgi:CubicO group peptidase (beta-lactamase class C family)
MADYDDRPGVVERQARRLRTLKLSRPAGAGFEYSNTNYNLLGLVIEAASGEPYAEYIQNHIFRPWGWTTAIQPRLKRNRMGWR